MKPLTIKPVKVFKQQYLPMEKNLIGDIRYHKERNCIAPSEAFPDYYTETGSKLFIKGSPEIFYKIGNYKYTIPAIPPHWKNEIKFKPHYKIDILLSRGKGSGTNAVKKVVRESLNDKETMGRVMLNAECIDGHSYPAGFYYKLGFRFATESRNAEIERWIKNGSNKAFAPTISGLMYLPKENIEHCLNYGM